MKITSARLKGFKGYRVSRIKEIYFQFNAPVQIITGMNAGGKELPNSCMVKVPGGWRRMGDIQVGDIVTAVDGTPTQVIGVYPQGVKPLYGIKFVDGRIARCGLEHLWRVHYKFEEATKFRIMSTAEMLEQQQLGEVAYIQPCASEQVPDVKLPIEPYLLGVLIGDGTLDGTPLITTDQWIIDKISNMIPLGVELRKRTTVKPYKVDYTTDYSVAGKMGKPNVLTYKLRKLGLDGTRSWNKFIPDIYLKASTRQRLELLQGLMDTDGYVSPRTNHNGVLGSGSIEYSTTSLELAKGVQYLVRSIGGLCAIREKQPFYTLPDGSRHPGKLAYILRVRVPRPGDLFTLPRKRDRMRPDGTNIYTKVFKIRVDRIFPLLEKEECTCIEVAHPSKLYIIEDFVVTHNTTTLQQLSPLPATRSDFEPLIGYKELNIIHLGHYYMLVSDFSSRTSPHHFIRDNEELNVSGSTEVQTELVEKHFGITQDIRNLIYQKVRICALQKAQRKAFFLNNNPLDLGLILDTHKKAQSIVKDCRANLQMLMSRKTDIEGKLLKPELLAQHKETKARLSEDLIAIDKVLYSLEQYVRALKDKYREDLEYQKQCEFNHRDLIPLKEMVDSCKSIMHRIHDYNAVARGDNYIVEREKLRSEGQSLTQQKRALEDTIRQLSDEINEYQKHLETAISRPVSTIEKEIQELDKVLENYKDLTIDNPASPSLINYITANLGEIRKLAFVFRDADTRMINPFALRALIDKDRMDRQSLDYDTSTLNRLKNTVEEQKKELNEVTASAGVPTDCHNTRCGLRQGFDRSIQSRQKSYQENLKQLETLQATCDKKIKEYTALHARVLPFQEANLLECYEELQRILSQIPIKDWNTELLSYVQNQPLKLVADLEEYISQSKLAAERDVYLKKRQQLITELDALSKTAGASKEFLEKQLVAKEALIKEHLAKLHETEKQHKQISAIYTQYLEYAEISDKVKEWNTIFTKGERALIVSKALEYWMELGKYLVQTKKKISEDLRHIETIVREQDILQATYDNEIIVNIKKISENKNIYEHIEMALSPTTGMPHKSMVKYLNAMINNVNHFLAQVWSYKMRIRLLAENEPLDYNFKMEVNNDVVTDIGNLSSGQTEMTNFAWVLTILLQLKMLNQMPFFADELGSTFDPINRMRLLQFLNSLINTKMIEQLFFVNHYAAMISGFQDADIICLSPDSMTELPSNTNENVQITYY